MPSESRALDLSDQIHGAVDFLFFAVFRWWQAVTHVWLRDSRIPHNKVCIGALKLGFLGQARLCVVVLLPAAVLPWRELKVRLPQ